MPWYLYLALRQLFPSGRRFPFFTVMSVASVSLGVALLVVVLSVMGGFGHEIRRMVVDTQGEVQVRSQAYIEDAKPVLKLVEALDNVEAATPFAEGVAILIHEHKPAYPAIQGIDLNRVEKVVPLRKYVRRGSLDDLDDTSVIMSYQLARSLGVDVGSKVEIYTPLIYEKMNRGEVMLPRELTVVGIFQIGHQQLDSSLVLCSLRTMQDLYGLRGAVHGINVRLKEGTDADAAAQRINASLPHELGLYARSWFEINQEFLWVLQFEKNMMMFIILFVVLVASFLTMSLLLVLVVKKTREIGLLAALGATRRQIALCFCVQGLSVGVVGTALGLALGFLVLAYRNDVVLFLNTLSGNADTLARFYQFSNLPSHTDPTDIVIIVVSAIVLSTLAGVIPAFMAARMKPVEALRSE